MCENSRKDLPKTLPNNDKLLCQEMQRSLEEMQQEASCRAQEVRARLEQQLKVAQLHYAKVIQMMQDDLSSSKDTSKALSQYKYVSFA